MTLATKIQFFASPPDTCSYLPDRDSVSVFVDPAAKMTAHRYSHLVNYGFRRSGEYVYRPQCPTCNACVPTRIPVAGFKPDRSQRRNLKANTDLSVAVRSAIFRKEHFALYQRYLGQRHAGGQMDNPTPESYSNFLIGSWMDTLFIEFRLDGQLLAIAVSDLVDNGLSAVYTFFEPDFEKRGLGNFAICWQIQEAQRRGLEYLYLGYWIKENEKMSYKTRFKPIEGVVDGEWRLLDE